jgi:hypothetical protein
MLGARADELEARHRSSSAACDRGSFILA